MRPERLRKPGGRDPRRQPTPRASPSDRSVAASDRSLHATTSSLVQSPRMQARAPPVCLLKLNAFISFTSVASHLQELHHLCSLLRRELLSCAIPRRKGEMRRGARQEGARSLLSSRNPGARRSFSLTHAHAHKHSAVACLSAAEQAAPRRRVAVGWARARHQEERGRPRATARSSCWHGADHRASGRRHRDTEDRHRACPAVDVVCFAFLRQIADSNSRNAIIVAHPGDLRSPASACAAPRGGSLSRCLMFAHGTCGEREIRNFSRSTIQWSCCACRYVRTCQTC